MNFVVDLISRFFLTEGKEKNWNWIDCCTGLFKEPNFQWHWAL